MLTNQEHEMLLYLFARYQQSLEILIDMLKREGIVSNDDVRAFSDVAHFDPKKRSGALRRAAREYLQAAQSAAVPLPESVLRALQDLGNREPEKE